MTKRSWSLILAASLIAGVFTALPAKAQTAVPETVNIEDIAQDANGVNDQLDGQTLGNQAGGAYVGSADYLKVWFSTTGDQFNVHMLTSSAGGGGNFAVIYRVHVNENCTWFQGSVDGATNTAAPTAVIRDACGEAEPVPGEIKIETLPDETGLTTMTFPVGSHPHVAAGATIAGPFASSRMITPSGHTVPQLDTTVVGTDYVIGSGGGSVTKPPSEEPPGKDDPPGKGKKKGCKKGKGKKKGACPGKKPPKGPKPPAAGACPAYVPGEQGAEAEMSIVTDAATAEAPLEVTISAPPGVPEVALGHAFHNIQVDTDAADSGLYVAYEFPVYEDHDIYLNYASGNEAAHAGGFNPAPVPVALGCCDGTGTGGHSEQGAEYLDGVRTADCGGYTLDMASFASEGGDMTLKLWLGEATYDPAPDGAASAMEMLYRAFGL